jgi:high affinity sulfate transporter 1
VSVAAVALPVGIAVARIGGFPPVVGIYSSILPLVAYALFGSSRQLMVNPDSAACTMLAATLAPLVAGTPEHYADLSIALTLMTGVMCIAAGFIGFGIIANFLSRPILTGYLNGIALSIFAGQLSTLLGFHVQQEGFLRTLWAVAEHLRETHYASLALGLGLLGLLVVTKRYMRRVPGPLLAAVAAIAAVYLLKLDRLGVEVVGPAPAGFPVPRIPDVRGEDLWEMIVGAAGITLVSFCSMMTTARGFAAKNRYVIDPNQDLIALGACQIASGLCHGFVVSGADSRTAVADSSGGKTQLTGVVAAAAMALVLMFLTGPIAYLPSVALAAILIAAAYSLFDFDSLVDYWRMSRAEFLHAIVAMVGVVSVGVLAGVLVAVGLALVRLLYLASWPHEAILGQGEDDSVLTEEEGGVMVDGLVIYRFDASLVFFNADHFRARVLAVADERKPDWFLFDAESSAFLDMTGADALAAVRHSLEERSIVFAIARAKGIFRTMLERTGVAEEISPTLLFPTVHSGIAAFRRTQEPRERRVAE